MTGASVLRAIIAAAAAYLACLQPLAAQPVSGTTEGETLVCPAAPSDEAPGPGATVQHLAADAMEGRLAGSPGAYCAGEYIAGRFEKMGLAPAGDDAGYFQQLPLASAINPHAPSGTGRNVVALLRGDDSSLAGDVLIVGAHYDHLGRGPFGSLDPESDQIHNGADDNASGVAVMLEVAELLTSRFSPARSILFVAFTGEEFGLLGSAHYVGDPAFPLESTVAMLNMDMVGRLEDGPVIVNGVGSAAEWEQMVSEAAATVGIEAAFGASGYGPSDQTSFYAREIPVLHFFTNVHGDYHRPSDDWEKIDAEGLYRIAALVANIAERVAESPARLTLQAEAPPPASEGGYGAYLGTVPDFAPVDFGVRLSGVSAGSPADAAGLREGDVLIRLGGQEIADLYAFTDALRAHSPGDTVQVVVQRDGEQVSLTAVLGSRGERE